jgi:flagellar motility protein MotE (MotC chaperone)
MKPKEAADLMANLGEVEALEVLLRLDPRAAASILSGLPKERATTLSRRMLAPRVKESVP